MISYARTGSPGPRQCYSRKHGKRRGSDTPRCSSTVQTFTESAQTMWSEIINRRFLNIAHRGARSVAPENTMAAARKALELGGDMWEIDVNRTADGKLIVIHDNTLERTSDAREIFPDRRPWFVHAFTLAELRRLDFGSWFRAADPFGRIAAGEVSAAEAAAYRGEPVPLLREALEFTHCHSWLVNIEIKDLRGTPGDRTIVEEVVSLVEAMNMNERVLISSFNHAYLDRVRRIAPRTAIGALTNRPVANPLALLRKLGAATFHPRAQFLRAKDVEKLRREGCGVLVWVVNDAGTMRNLIARRRVAGIFTDFPQVLAQVLRNPLVSTGGRFRHSPRHEGPNA